MAKFINKKEQVYDLKLTPYGKHLISMGTFKPEYYAFFDNNIIYDGRGAGIVETQNEIGQRIKQETQYLESLVLFEDVQDMLTQTNSNINEDEATNYFDVDVNPFQITPTKDAYRFTSMIGDAYLNGEQQQAPAWKIVTLNGKITSTTQIDDKNDVRIPQVNIALNYELKINSADAYETMTEEEIRKVLSTTRRFSDGNVVQLISDDLLIYVEEMNTDMLSENFDIEIFEIETDGATLGKSNTNKRDAFRRKYFKKDHQRIMGSLMTEESISDFDPISDDIRGINLNYTTSSVGYYFDLLKDHQINNEIACKAADEFNKESYYIDLDFKCEEISETDNYYIDLYGPVTEPEICP